MTLSHRDILQRIAGHGVRRVDAARAAPPIWAQAAASRLGGKLKTAMESLFDVYTNVTVRGVNVATLDERRRSLVGAETIFHYQGDGLDILAVPDTRFLTTAAYWAVEEILPTADDAAAGDAKPGPLEQRLAAIVARALSDAAAEAVSRMDDAPDPQEGEDALAALKAPQFELAGDIRRLMFSTPDAPHLGCEAALSYDRDQPLGVLNFIICGAALSVWRERAQAAAADDGAFEQQPVARIDIGSVPVIMQAVAARADARLGALADLQPGDVLPLPGATLDAVALGPETAVGAPSDDPDAVVLTGRLGVIDGSRALKAD